MPNIIEQQDLLKGLPDARLAMLMQKPDASIPPFLVAAEAQRRQSIRQQFGGDGSKESVVDTLTKQLANVPQNIQAPMQTPPNIPAPAGIAAIPQQGMADGGPVRRFAADGFVAPSTASGISSLSRDEYIKQAEADKIAQMNPGRAKYLLMHPTVPKTVKQIAEDRFKAATEGPLSGFYTEADVYDAAKALEDAKKRSAEAPVSTGMTAEDRRTPTNPAPAQPRDETSGTETTSNENKYKAKEAEIRKRLEDLYGTDEPSNWEEAQKWFEMSAQIMNPDATLMQGLVSAGAVYAGAEGEQARQKREGDRALQEALLNYDMQIMQSDRAAEAAAAAKADERAWELKKGQMLRPSDAIGALGDLIKGVDKKLEDAMLDDATKQSLLKERQMYELQLANIMRSGGYGASGVITRDQLPQ